MKKETIKNRKGQNIVLVVERVEPQKGLAFVMHGLGGFKEQPHLEVIAEAFKENGYTVVRFDTTNSIGESGGKTENATITSYYEDLEDVIGWSKAQDWYQEPFCLAGHSLGGICTALYAEKYPEKVKALAPISTMISGELSLEVWKREELKKWEKSGWWVRESVSKPGVIIGTPWSFIADLQKYDLLRNVSKLPMPVLLIVGEYDRGTSLEHQRILYDALPGEKELHIVKNVGHNFREVAHFKEIKSIFDRWIKNKLK